jgi:small subunit ribosomal protein S1
VDHIKGGLVVDIGVRAFLPASQADAHPVRDLVEWNDRELTVRVLKMNRKRGNVVVSRRAILDEQLQAQKQAMLDSMAEGQTVKGVVKNVTGYGAFVDLGGIDGLLHITDMSWGRVASPLDAVRPGEEVEVKILKYDREKGRISLGVCGGALCDRHKTYRQNYGPDRLRRICGTRAGHRRTGARQRNELVQA